MKKLFNILVYVIITPVVLFAIFLAYSTVADYKPEPVVTIFESKGSVINVYDTLNVFNWNIGYSGLGKDMSFFYDGGDRMRTSKEQTHKNLEGILDEINKHDSIDFYLFQEVDLKSRRSYKTNQRDSIAAIIPDFSSYLSLNYKVDFIPVPVSNPMGGVKSGLVSFSKDQPYNVTRHAFIGNYSWPKSLFLLDRCFMVQRFYTSNGKELLVINTHNSAYDDGSLRKKQMELMKNFLVSEYDKGNYIIVGGDWNQNPPISGKESVQGKEGRLTRIRMASDIMPVDWNWLFCEQVPTNRMIDEVYNEKTTITNTIDFFLLSPNLVSVSQNNVNLNFENSDHNPTLLSFSFLR